MQNVIARSAFIAIALASSAAFAGPTAELKVTGVIKPVACTPTIGAGSAVVDYGNIASGALTAGQNKKLDTKEVPFTIACEAPVKMAVSAIDNRAASKVTGLAAQIGGAAGETSMFGLGAAGGKNIGAFHFAMKQGSFTGDGASVDTIGTASAGSPSWSKSAIGGMSTDRLLSWAPSGTATPGAYQTVSGTLSVTAVLNKPENLNLTGDINLDGSATIEVKYL
jgi:type 1 fimbria pilin